MELKELRGEAFWVDIEGTSLKIKMLRPTASVLFGTNAEAHKAFWQSIVDWNITDEGNAVPVDPSVFPADLAMQCLKDWLREATEVSSPLS